MIDFTLAASFVVIFAISALGLLLAMSKLSSTKSLDRDFYQKKWEIIEAQFKDGKSGMALAVVSADKLLDKAMNDKSFKGKTMGDKLKQHPTSFSDINDLWRAHKLRNSIAHDQRAIEESDCRSALDSFRTALKDVGAL